MTNRVQSVVVTNMLYGVVALIPIAVVILVVVEILKLLGEVAKPLALHSRAGAALVVIAGLIALAVVCFLLGSLIRTRLRFDDVRGDRTEVPEASSGL